MKMEKIDIQWGRSIQYRGRKTGICQQPLQSRALHLSQNTVKLPALPTPLIRTPRYYF